MSQEEEKKQARYELVFKLAAVKRVLGGEGVSAVASELGIRRKRLYVWKDRFAQLGEGGLKASLGGRPRKDAAVQPAEPMAGRGELLAARKRIAELERKVGQQELELDFFGEALRRVDAVAKQKGAKRSAR